MSKRFVVVALSALVVVVLALVVAGLVLRDDGDDDGSTEVALEDGLPVLPAQTLEPAFGTKPAEPVGDAAVVLPSPPPTADATWNALTRAAEANGRVPVIVTLKTRVQPEGLLTSAARSDQRRRIGSLEEDVLRLLSGEVADVERFEAVPILALEATPAALADLRRLPEVASVVEDVAHPIPTSVAVGGAQADEAPADWWDLEQAGVVDAVTRGYDGTGQTVAIVDSGVRSDHPWLSGKVVTEACFSRGAGCPNGQSQQTGAGAAAPCTYAPADCAHGTHVAHTAAGKYGVARDARILAYQVFSRVDGELCTKYGLDDPCALTYTSDQLKALQHVYSLRASHRIAAVNVSIGSGKHLAYCDVADANGYAAWAKTLSSVGIATVVSSGNNGYPDALTSPACNSTVVSVGATTMANGADAVPEWSNSAEMLNLLAPGAQICSAVPESSANPELDYECDWNGTSMAAPHVTGAFAVLRELQPSVTVATAQSMLSASGTPVTDSRNQLVRPRLHVYDALVALNNS
jgi:subtilisin family serine protease